MQRARRAWASWPRRARRGQATPAALEDLIRFPNRRRGRAGHTQGARALGQTARRSASRPRERGRVAGVAEAAEKSALSAEPRPKRPARGSTISTKPLRRLPEADDLRPAVNAARKLTSVASLVEDRGALPSTMAASLIGPDALAAAADLRVDRRVDACGPGPVRADEVRVASNAARELTTPPAAPPRIRRPGRRFQYRCGANYEMQRGGGP